MIILQYANIILRFLLEICGLIALGYWGFRVGNGYTMKILFGFGIPTFIAVVWGFFGSPNAKIQLSTISHILLEIVIFGLPALALYASGHRRLTWYFVTCVIINRLLLLLWKQ